MHFRLRVLAGLLTTAACCLGAAARAQEQAPEPQPPAAPFMFAIPKAALATKQPAAILAIVLDLRAREAEALADPMLARNWLDVVPWYLVAAGEHRVAGELEVRFREHIGYPKQSRRDTPPFDADSKAEPAVVAILAAAKDRRVVMFNEEHRSSVQRAFLNRVVDGLAAAGFTHLAVEAVNTGADQRINELGHAVLATGVYTLDPALADALRRARAAGMTIVSYDHAHPSLEKLTPEQLRDPVLRENHREANAARHLQDVLERDPKARLVVYAGRGHICEKAATDWNTMCARLAAATGVDPLTVELTHMVEFDERRLEHDAYRHADDRKLLGDEPVVLREPDGELWSEMRGGYDVSVFHPRTRWRDGRPEYLRMGGLRRAHAVEVDRAKIPGPVLLQARRRGEPADAVAVDQVILWPGQPTPALLLPPGRYTVLVLDRDSAELHRADVDVPA